MQAGATEAAAPERREQLERAARYLGLLLLAALLLAFLLNVLLCCGSFLCAQGSSLLATVGRFKLPSLEIPIAAKLPDKLSDLPDQLSNLPEQLSEKLPEQQQFDFYGINIFIFSLFLPFFLYFALTIR